MNKVEIEQIAEYVEDREEGLNLRVHQRPCTFGDLDRLDEVISRLADTARKTKDQELATFLIDLEDKVRMYKQCIEERLAVKN